MKTINDFASKHLGQSGSYAVYTDKFDPSLLVPMPRELARRDWGITGDEFVGVDTWHCHEATFLLNNGLPIAGTLKIIYSASSKFMVESKSIKLYLNSFDMCKMGDTIEEAISNYEKQVKSDLSRVLETPVEVCFFGNNSDMFGENPGEEYSDLYSIIEEKDLLNHTFTDYQAKEEHIKFIPEENSTHIYKVTTNVLRSRCRHTKQKDTGAAFFYIKTKNAQLDLISLLEEVVSLREVNEFHEFCAEKLFTTLKKHPEVTDCCVMLLYARRGSLDINPVRATNLNLIPRVLKDVQIYTTKQTGQ
jgi:7-cyano-7-deazaguanine reductase